MNFNSDELGNKSDWEIEFILQVLLSGFEPVDALPKEGRRHYIARDYENSIYPPSEARQYIDIEKYCSDWNAVMPIATRYQISSVWVEEHSHWLAEQRLPNQLELYAASYCSNRIRAVCECLVKVLFEKEGARPCR